MTPVGGWLRQTMTPLASPPRNMVAWTDAQDHRYLAIGCDGKVYVREAEVVTDITPAGYIVTDSQTMYGGYGNDDYGVQDYGDARETMIPSGYFRANTISLSAFGNYLLFSSSADGRLFKWNPTTGGAATLIGTAPINIRASLVNQQRTVMVIGGNGTPKTIRWSNRETFDQWDITDTNTAGELPLDTSGYLVTMKSVREGTLVWGDQDLFLIRFVGAPFYYVADKIGQNDSLFSPSAIASFDGRAMWMTRRGFQMYDGGYVKEVPCELADFVFKDIDQFWGRTRTTAFMNGKFPEVWFLYPSHGATENDSYIFYDFVTGYWSKGKLKRSCGMSPEPTELTPLMCSPDGHIWSHENGDAFTSFEAGDIFVESAAIHPVQGRTFECTRVLPDSGSGATSTEFTFYTKLAPDGPEYVKGPYIPRLDGKLDCRFSAREVRVRIRQKSPGVWTVGEPEFDLKPRGTR